MTETNQESVLIDMFKDLFNFSRDVLWTIGIDGAITYVSPAIFTLRGIDQKTALSQTIDQIHPPESAARSTEYFLYMTSEISQGRKPEPFTGELDYYHANGSILTTEVYAVPAYDNNDKFMFLAGVSRDISARRLIEAEKNARQQAKDMEFRSMLHHILEHEMRNALFLINYALDDTAFSNKITVARQASKNLLEVLEQIKLFSSSDKHETEILRKPTALLPVIRDIEQLIIPTEPFEVSDINQSYAFGERSLIHMCLAQIIGNAVKYSDPNTKVSIVISSENRNNKDGTVVSVMNTHTADKSLNLERVFEPFYRSPRITNISGSGLGLTIAERTARLLGGEVTIHQQNKQVRVGLWLPSVSFN